MESNNFETKSLKHRGKDEKMTIRMNQNQIVVVLEPSDLQSAMKLQIEQIKDKAANKNYNWEIFDIKQEIGAGTFGQVFASLDQKTGKKYALKFIGYDDESDQDPEFKAAVREIVIMQTLSQTNCQGLLKIYDIYPCIKDDNKFLVIVMELCDCNLMELLKVRIEENKTKWTDEELLYILYQLIEGFVIMKKHNVTHRDIKPQNILYCQADKSYKIADLGGAKFLKPKQAQLNTVRGSPAYWAPEIYFFCDLQKDKEGRFFVGKQHLNYDPYTSDVYSVGITFLLMRKLIPRLDRESLKIEVEMLRKLKQPSIFEQILIKMLEYDDQKRISFDDLLQLLSSYKDLFKKPNEDVFVNCLKTQQDKKNLSAQDLMMREVKLAEAYEKLNLPEHAKSHYELALKYAIKLSKDSAKADIMNSLGTVNCDLEQYDEAEKNFCESVALYKKLNGDKHSSVADGYNNLGIVKRKKGEFEKAIKHYEQAYQIKEQIFGENNLGGAVILQNIAMAHKKLKNYDQAIKYFKSALQIKKLLCGDRSPILCSTYDNLARVYYEKQQFDMAISFYSITAEIYRKHQQSNQQRLSDTLFEIALCFQKIGRSAETIKAAQESYNLRKQIYGQYAKQTVKSQELLSQSFLEEGRYEEALQHYNQLKQFYIDNLVKCTVDERFDSMADILKNLGASYMGIQKYDKALEHYKEGIEFLMKRNDNESTRMAKIYYNMGLVYRKIKDFKSAEQYYQTAASLIATSKSASDLITLGDIYNNFGVLYGTQDKFVQAKKYFQMSLEHYQKVLGPNHSICKEVQLNIKELEKWLAK
ncbi:unnamed protein product [Paramecium primaurelia]|uniref:Protein kinase domain-containing protein n=1 Tax=Paramecium primaurelia TaxID=5886 RepID=A0A8S1N6X1_PARPR|nr:unnamed protein product [Paramecium primaurelia]